LGKFIRGQVVVLNFPFSDPSQTRRRPALVLATAGGEDIILCQITSQNKFDQYSVTLDGADFATGGLNRPSFVRPNRLFTADSSIVLYGTSVLLTSKLEQVLNTLVAILQPKP